jgi:hypothetical protein
MSMIRVALTIDDLPQWPHYAYPASYTSEGITSDLIHAMAKHHITGVYAFSNSWPLEKSPAIRQIFDRWVEAGHYVANHTHSHKTTHEVSAEEYIQEIETAERYLEPWMSQSPGKYFRHTRNLWGDTEEKVTKIKNHLDTAGYSIGEISSWSYDSRWDRAYKRCLEEHDTDGVRFLKDAFLDFSVAQLTFDTEEARRWHGRDFNGIILGHNVPFMAEMADPMFERFLAEGVEFIPLEEAIDDPIFDGAATFAFACDRVLVHWRKVAYHQGHELPTIAPGFEAIYRRVEEMGKGL